MKRLLCENGLLHEIGYLVLCARMPDYARESTRHSVQAGIPLHEAQRQMLGCHYGDIGAMLLANWNLPVELQNLVRYHPTPSEAPDQPLETALLHLAHACVGRAASAVQVPVDELIAADIRATIDLSRQQVDEALESARAVSLEIGKGIVG